MLSNLRTSIMNHLFKMKNPPKDLSDEYYVTLCGKAPVIKFTTIYAIAMFILAIPFMILFPSTDLISIYTFVPITITLVAHLLLIVGCFKSSWGFFVPEIIGLAFTFVACVIASNIFTVIGIVNGFIKLEYSAVDLKSHRLEIVLTNLGIGFVFFTLSIFSAYLLSVTVRACQFAGSKPTFSFEINADKKEQALASLEKQNSAVYVVN